MPPRRWHTGLAVEPEGVQALREVHAAGAQLDAAAHHDARRGGRQLVRLAAQRRLLRCDWVQSPPQTSISASSSLICVARQWTPGTADHTCKPDPTVGSFQAIVSRQAAPTAHREEVGGRLEGDL